MLESTLFRNILIDMGTTITNFARRERVVSAPNTAYGAGNRMGNQWTENY